MGTPDFAVPALRALAEAGYEIIGVVTQPDKPKGRGKTMLPTPVKEEAFKYGLPVYQPVKVRDQEFQEILRELQPDLIVVAAFGQIIPKTVLDLPKYGCINIHASLLPKYRGAAPIQWAILDGEKESGVTIMKMDVGLDTGDMIAKKVIPLDPKETGGTLFEKLAREGAALLLETLPSVFDGTAVYEPQPEESTTHYASMITKQMGRLDFSKEAQELERLIRGLNPWPSAYTTLDGKTLKVWSCAVISMKRCEAALTDCGDEECRQAPENTKEAYEIGEKAAAGTVIRADKQGIAVACGKDALLLQEVQLEGKKRMSADAFLRGYPVAAGTRLGAV